MAKDNILMKEILDTGILGIEFDKFCNSVKNCTNVSDVKIFSYISKKIAIVTFNVKVNLPLRRSKMKVKIKEIENVLLLCSIDEIYYRAPMVFSSRNDFPVNKLPHTFFLGDKSYICLHRGNIDDWYIEHTTEEFISRIRSWFSDAASGQLIRGSDEFQPMLIEYRTGNIIYNYSEVTNFIESYWKQHDGRNGYAFIIFSSNTIKDKAYLNIDDNSISIQINGIYNKNSLSSLIRENQLTSVIKNNKFIGILTWGFRDNVCSDYFELSKGTLGDLNQLDDNLDTNFRRALKVLLNKNIKRGISLVLYAVKRPTKLEGLDSNIEILNFIVQLKREIICKTQRYDINSHVAALNHLESFTSKLASKISGSDITNMSKKILFVGAGALGSKIVFHLARNGFNNIKIIDNDILLSHNLARHALFADSIGKSKSSEIVHKLNSIYYLDNSKSFSNEYKSFISYAKNNDINNFDVLLDFSASKPIFSYLSSAEFKFKGLLIRGEITDKGKLGLLMRNGYNKNTELDETAMILFFNSVENSQISNWLKRYYYLKENVGESQFEDIVIGLGCNTNTMVLSDEIISYHAAIFANYIKKSIKELEYKESISISYFNENDYSKNCFKKLDIKDFSFLHLDKGGWTIKLYNLVWEKIQSKLEKSSSNETGGILLGHLNLNKKCIYVMEIFTPPDSIGGPYLFNKGSEETKKYLHDIMYKTGEMITYVGDWHTHPNMGTEMSHKDALSLKEIKEKLKGTPYPAHIMIFNNDSFNSYIL
ncbi:thiamine biosynthesis protein ThiF [Clostridium autoethanogenum]|uniref:Thiamine biosynthesis protein ThiF n=1 Tax=Clostridium autoethanogenum TaxID=84023 RepID=A0A3M0S3D3_9CLOT|nr:ThiF family adenylyltransferase [Clostridium autoethanogenum]RMC93016.1 thiamine biosynthesis protein ThiF [Clostridium autoethanogenum]